MKVILARQQAPEAFASPIHQAQQRSWNERYAIHEQNARMWRYTAFGCIGIALVSVCGVAWIGAQSKITPYIVERDRLGDEVAVRLADKAAPIDPRTLEAEVSRWVFDVRTVSTDATTEKHFIQEAYDHTDRNGAAVEHLNEWFRDNNPWKRAADEMVDVEVLSALPDDKTNWKTWRVDWRENTRSRTGMLESSKIHEVIMTVAVTPPAAESDVRKNAAGMYVKSFSWTVRQG